MSGNLCITESDVVKDLSKSEQWQRPTRTNVECGRETQHTLVHHWTDVVMYSMGFRKPVWEFFVWSKFSRNGQVPVSFQIKKPRRVEVGPPRDDHVPGRGHQGRIQWRISAWSRQVMKTIHPLKLHFLDLFKSPSNNSVFPRPPRVSGLGKIERIYLTLSSLEIVVFISIEDRVGANTSTATKTSKLDRHFLASFMAWTHLARRSGLMGNL